MLYTIKVSYRTGNSFNTHDEIQTVGLFHSVEEAKDACDNILNHLKFFKSLEDYRVDKKKVAALVRDAKKSSWVVESDYEQNNICKFSVAFGEQRLEAFWMGYFEQLYSLEIIAEEKELIFYP